MPSGFYNVALLDIANGTIDLDTDVLKVMLLDENYIYDPDHDVIDNALNNATDPSFNELSGVTGYTGGFGGAGRKTATIVGAEDDANNRAKFDLSNITWTAIGGASQGNVSGAILVKEITGDTLSRLIAFFDLATTGLNGGDLTLNFDANAGDLQFNA